MRSRLHSDIGRFTSERESLEGGKKKTYRGTILAGKIELGFVEGVPITFRIGGFAVF